ncbi:31512_t:CDS:2, partial [Racocetra persica]
PGSSEMTIPLGIEFDNLEVTLLAEQLQRITVAAEHEIPKNKQEQKLNQLYLEAIQREINQFRKQVIGKDNTKKDKKGKAKSLNITFNQQERSKVKSPKIGTFIKTQLSQLNQILQQEKEQKDPKIRTGLRQLKQQLKSMKTNYKYVSQLSRQQTNEHIKEIERVMNRKIKEAETTEDKKNRDLVKDIEEDYAYTTNAALNLDRKDFEEMQEQMKQCESEPLREQYQAKYRELLGVSLENLDKMHDIEDEKE